MAFENYYCLIANLLHILWFVTASKSQIVRLDEGQYQGAIAVVDVLVEIEIIIVVNTHIFICFNMIINFI